MTPSRKIATYLGALAVMALVLVVVLQEHDSPTQAEIAGPSTDVGSERRSLPQVEERSPSSLAEVGAPSRQPEIALAPVQEQTEVEEELDEGSPQPTRGRVIDAITRGPIAGALVVLGDQTELSGMPSTATSGAGGCFVAPPLDRSSQVTVKAPGYRQQSFGWFTLVEGECGRVLPLELGATLEGVVVDTRGRPITSGRVFAFDQQENEHYWLNSPRLADRFTTSAFHGEPDPFLGRQLWTPIENDGSYRFTSFAADEPRSLLVLSPETVLKIVATIVVPVLERRELKIVVERASSLPGKLTGPGSEEPTRFGLWLCTHDVWAKGHPGENGHAGASFRDTWIPVKGDGSFVLGPMPYGKEAWVRLGFNPPRSAPDGAFDWDTALYVSPEGWRHVPQADEEAFLTVDLERGPTFLLEEHR